MSFNLGSAHGEIVIDYDGAGVQQAMGDLSSLQQTGTNLMKAGAGLGGFGAAIGGALVGATNQAADFEFQMDAVNAALGGLDASQMETVTQQALDMGAASKFSAGEVAGVQEQLAKSGLSVEQITGGATQAVLDLAAATGEGLAPATVATAAALNLFGIDAAQTADVADIFTAGLNASSASLGDFQMGINNLGPVMANLNQYVDDGEGAFRDTAAAVAYFNANGLKAAEAGISLARGLTNLADPASEATALMQQLGINAFDAQGNFIGFPDLMDQLQGSMSGMSDQAREAALSTIFGAEAADVMNQAIKSGGDGLREYQQNLEANGQAAEQAAIRQDNLRGSIEQLGGSIQTAAIALGTVFLDPVRAIVEGITGLVNAFNSLPPSMQETIATIAAVVAGFSLLSGGILTAAGAILRFGPAFAAAAAAAAPFLAVLAAIAAAIGLGILAYKTDFLGFGRAVDKGLANARKAISAFGNAFEDAFSENQVAGLGTIAAGIAALGTAINAAFGLDLTDQFRAAAEAVQAFGDAFATDLAGGASPVIGILDGIGAALRSLGFEEAGTAVQSLATQMQDFGNVFGQVFAGSSFDSGPAKAIEAIGVALREVTGIDITGFTDNLAGMADNLANAFSNLGVRLTDGMGSFFDLVGSEWGTVRDMLGQMLQGDFAGAMQTLGDAFGQLGGNIGATLSNLGTSIGSALQGIGSAIGTAISTIDPGAIAQGIGSVLSAAIAGIGNFLGAIDFSGIVSTVGNALGAAFSTIGTFVSTVAVDIATALRDALSGVGDFLGAIDFGSLLQTVSDQLLTAFQGAGDFVSGVAQQIGTAISGALGQVASFIDGSSLGDLGAKVMELITSALGGGGGQLSGSGDLTGGGGFAGLAQSIGSQIGSALNSIGDFLSGFNPSTLATNIQSKVNDAVNALTFTFTDMGSNIASALEAACGVDLGAAFDSLAQAASGVGTALSSAGMAISSAIASIKAALADLNFDSITEAANSFASAIPAAMAIAQSAITGAVSAIQSTLEGLNFDGISEKLTALGQAVPAAMAIIQSAITGAVAAVQAALSGLTFDDVLTKINDLGSAVPAAMAIVQSAITGAATTIQAAITGINFGSILTAATDLAGSIGGVLTGILGTVSGWVGSIVAEIGKIGAAFTDAFSSPEAQATGNFIDPRNLIPDFSQIGSSDQAKTAAAQSGDFAVNFIAAIAASFAAADWSPVTNAINSGLQGALTGGGGSNGTGSGALEANGGNGTSGSGLAIAQTFVTGIAAAFTPELFAPIKTAFDTALASAFAGAAAGGGGGGDGATSGTQIATSLVTGIASALGTQVEPLKAALQAVVTAAGAGIETSGLQSTGQAIIQAIASSFGAQTGTITAALQAVITAAIAGANATAATANAVGTAMIAAVGAGIGAGAGTVISAMQAMVQSAIDGGNAAAAGADAIGTAMTAATAAGVGAGTGTIVGAMQAAIGAAIDGGIGAAAGASAIGAAIAQGIAAGIGANTGLIVDAAVAAVGAAIAGAKAAAGIASPSKVAVDEIGKPIAQGVALGMESETSLVQDAAVNMVTGTMDAARPYLEQAASEFKNWGLTFGNELSGGLSAGVGGTGISKLADALRSNAGGRVERLRSLGDSIRENQGFAAGGQQSVQTTGKVEMDGRAMGDFVIQTSIAPLTKVRERGGGRSSRFEGAGR